MRAAAMRPAAPAANGAGARAPAPAAAVATPPPVPVAAPALSLTVFHTNALLRSVTAAARGPEAPAVADLHGGVESLFRLLQRLGADEVDGGAHLPALLDLMPAATTAVHDGRRILVAEGWTRGLHQCQAQVGGHLPSLRAVAHALLLAVSTLNAHLVFHKRWRLEQVRFDAHGRVKLEGTLCNNAEARGENDEATTDDDQARPSDFMHPVFIPPEVLLAGPNALHDAEAAPILLKSDSYQLGMLLLFLLRGSLPLAPAAPRAAVAGNEGESLQPSGDDAEQSTAAEDDERAVEEVWQLHFAQRPSHSGSDGDPDGGVVEQHKHPRCNLCSPDSVQQSAGATAATARLCLRCWLDMRNLHPSFTATSFPAPAQLSLLSSTVATASPAYLGAYASFLEMLAGLTDANPLSRLAAGDACNHPFFSLTARWGSKEKQARNVAHVWRRKFDAALPGLGDTAALLPLSLSHGAGRANSLRTETNQLALDPFFQVRGFSSVQAGPSFAEGAAAAAAAAAASGAPAPPRVCGVCHQPLAPHIHPSSPAACHCLQPFSCADLYHVWRDALAQQGLSLQQWVEAQSAAANAARLAEGAGAESSTDTHTGASASGSPLDEPWRALSEQTRLSGVTRYNAVVDALPAMVVSASSSLPWIARAAEAEGRQAAEEREFQALSLGTPALPAAQRFFVPLLPLYDVLRRCIVARQQREVAALWAGLDLAEKERAEAEAAAAAAAAASQDAGADKDKTPAPLRLRKVAPPTTASSASDPLDGVLSDPVHAFLVRTLSALVEVRLALRLYPATRGELVQLARGRVEELYAPASAPVPDQWRVYRAGAGAVAPPSIVPHALRGALWPALLGVSHRDTSGYTVATEWSLTSLQSHPESAQIAKDCERLRAMHPALAGRVAQLRLARMLRVYLSTHGEVVYWQGMHELLGAVAALYFREGSGAGGECDGGIEALAYGLFERLVSRPYLRDMFVRDNASALKAKISCSTRLLCFVDPLLARHLSEALGCPFAMWLVPSLFTAYAHVLPLEQLWAVWDVLFAHAAAPEDEFDLQAEGQTPRQRRAARRDAEDRECELFTLLPVALLHLLRSTLLPKSGAAAAAAAGAGGSGFQEALVSLSQKLHTVDTRDWVRMLWRVKADIHPAVLRAVIRAGAACRDQAEGQLEPEEDASATSGAAGAAGAAGPEEEDEDFLPEPVMLSMDFTPIVAAAVKPTPPAPEMALLAPALPLATLRELMRPVDDASTKARTPAASPVGVSAAAAGAKPTRKTNAPAPILVVDLRDESRRAAPAFPNALTVPMALDWSGAARGPSPSLLAAVEWVSQYAQEWRTQLEQSHALALSKASQSNSASSFIALLADETAPISLVAHHLIAAGVPRVCTVSL